MNTCLLVMLGFCIVAPPGLFAGDRRADAVLLKGGDISMLSRLEEQRAIYRDGGRPTATSRAPER